MAGVRFDVRGMVQLRRASPDCEAFPLGARIPTGRTFRHLHALHGARWPVREGLPIAAFVLHYADGTQAELPVLYGVHLRHESVGSEGKTDCSDATLAWAGPPAEKPQPWAPRLYKATFLNPHPEREVHQIEYVSKMTQSAPFLVAVTVD